MAALSTCPLCEGELAQLTPSCPHCDGDLRPLVRVVEAPDHYVNRALAAIRGTPPDWHGAAEHLAVALVLRPDDVEAVALMGKVQVKQGRRAVGVATLEEASRRFPTNAAIRETLAWAVATTGRAKRPSGRANPPGTRPAPGGRSRKR